MEVDELHKKCRKDQNSNPTKGNIEILSKCGKNDKKCKI